MSLPQTFSALLLSDLGEEPFERVTAAIAHLPEVSWDDRQELLAEFLGLHRTELTGEWPTSVEALEELYYREPKRFVATLNRFYL
jgi:hypothetical protein